MNTQPMSEWHAAVWQTMRRINDAWVHNQIEDLRDLLHASIVVVAPGGELVRGQAACIESYRDFTVQAKVLRFEELTPEVDVFGDTAVVTYTFEIFYELGGTWTTERGREIVVF